MKAPEDLSHKPIVSMKDYDQFDGMFAKNTDAMALSIGFAQYANEKDMDQRDISLKVWRKPNKIWSRQSEELPIHRNLDLTILLLKTLTNDNLEEVDNICIHKPEKVQKIKDFCTENREHLNHRFKELYLLLSEYLNDNKL